MDASPRASDAHRRADRGREPVLCSSSSCSNNNQQNKQTKPKQKSCTRCYPWSVSIPLMQQQRTRVRPEEQSVRRSGVAFSDIARTGGAEEELRSRAERSRLQHFLGSRCSVGGDERRLCCRAPTAAATLAAELAWFSPPNARWRHQAANTRNARSSVTQTFLNSAIDANPKYVMRISEVLT